MNQTTILQIAAKLERLAGRLTSKIRKAVLSELTPLKELFLKQRPPRFLFIGSSKMPTHQILNALFSPDAHEQMNVAVMPVHRWVDWDISGHGTISVLDARDADASAAAQVEDDLKRQPPDIVFVLMMGNRKSRKHPTITPPSWPCVYNMISAAASATPKSSASRLDRTCALRNSKKRSRRSRRCEVVC